MVQALLSFVKRTAVRLLVEKTGGIGSPTKKTLCLVSSRSPSYDLYAEVFLRHSRTCVPCALTERANSGVHRGLS